jgi:type II restriction enzyme
MNLSMPGQLARRYKSLSQQARVVTQAWGESNLYCPNCTSAHLHRSREGELARDFVCPKCELPFELKSQSKPIGGVLRDAGYSAMIGRIRSAETPNLFVLHYIRPDWMAYTLFLVPHFIFSESAIKKCKPLSATHPRAGHVLCNIILKSIPQGERIPIVTNGVVSPASKVRAHYERLRPKAQLSIEEPGWPLDVLRAVQSLGKKEFKTSDMYRFVRHFKELHPDNRHVKDKIRQQLQVLRDRGFLAQVERGVWAVK